MFEITILNTVVYSISFCAVYYIFVCLYAKKIVTIELRKLFFYITLFCLFGISGEILVNTVWELIFSVQLWEYHLYPAHNNNVSYYFILIWGMLGYCKYLNDSVIYKFNSNRFVLYGFVMGAEAILLELSYNGLFLLLFGDYIFYYFPDNLGIFSHISCLEVIPFYFIVGSVTSALINQQNKIGYSRRVFTRMSFYWMLIAVVMFF